MYLCVLRPVGQNITYQLTYIIIYSISMLASEKQISKKIKNSRQNFYVEDGDVQQSRYTVSHKHVITIITFVNVYI